MLVGDELQWTPIPQHPHLYHKEILTAQRADEMAIRVSSILWEKIGVGGAVLPHYHDVAEIIYITKGRVRLLCNGIWKAYGEGDTFQVPAGTVHSVYNDDTQPTEQISVFIPTNEDGPTNCFFQTHLVKASSPFDPR